MTPTVPVPTTTPEGFDMVVTKEAALFCEPCGRYRLFTFHGFRRVGNVDLWMFSCASCGHPRVWGCSSVEHGEESEEETATTTAVNQ